MILSLVRCCEQAKYIQMTKHTSHLDFTHVNINIFKGHTSVNILLRHIWNHVASNPFCFLHECLQINHHYNSSLSPLVVRRWSSSPGTPLLLLSKRNGTGQEVGKLSATSRHSQFLGNQGYPPDRKVKSHLEKWRYNKGKPKASSLSANYRGCHFSNNS